jgi:hypothetical protein
MVATRKGTVTSVSEASHGRLYDKVRHQTTVKKKQARGPSIAGATRAGVAQVSTPPELKGVGKSGVSTFPESRRLTRNTDGGPRCFHFGRSRHVQYKHESYFFCGKCDNVDNGVGKGTIDYNSRTFRCQASHTSFIFPTHKTKSPVYRPSMAVDYSASNTRRANGQTKREHSEIQDDGEKKLENYASKSPRLTESSQPTPTRRLEFSSE